MHGLCLYTLLGDVHYLLPRFLPLCLFCIILTPQLWRAGLFTLVRRSVPGIRLPTRRGGWALLYLKADATPWSASAPPC